MNALLSRRVLMLLPPALILGGSATEEGTTSLQALERRFRARIGVAALDTGSGRTLHYRENERFLMCSSFKLSLAAAILKRAESAPGKLDQVIRYTEADLL